MQIQAFCCFFFTQSLLFSCYFLPVEPAFGGQVNEQHTLSEEVLWIVLKHIRYPTVNFGFNTSMFFCLHFLHLFLLIILLRKLPKFVHIFVCLL